MTHANVKILHNGVKSSAPTFMPLGQLGQNNFTIMHQVMQGGAFNRHARAAYGHAIIIQMCVCQELLTCITYYIYQSIFIMIEGQSSILSEIVA